MRLPSSAQPFVFGALLSGFMSLVVSGVATVKAIGLVEGLAGQWLTAWLASWAVAFPVVLVVAPVVRRLTARIVAPAAGTRSGA